MFESIKKALDILRNPPDPNWHVQRSAKPSKSHPYAGFWKRKPHHEFGLAIGPAGKGMYFVSFCGPGGCFEKGSYRPNTTLTGDPAYRVIDENNIDVKSRHGFARYTRASSLETAGK